MTGRLFSIAYISRSDIVADALGGPQEIQRILDVSSATIGGTASRAR